MLSSHLHTPNMMLNCLRERIHPNYERAPGCKKGRGSRALNCLIFQRYCQNESRAVGTFLSYCPVTGEKYRLALELLREVGYQAGFPCILLKLLLTLKRKVGENKTKEQQQKKTSLLLSLEASQKCCLLNLSVGFLFFFFLLNYYCWQYALVYITRRCW